jgi:hypothetical protein
MTITGASSDAEFRARARELHGIDGEVEVDSGAVVSRGDDPGAYVQAWVWVPFTEEAEASDAR